MFVAVADVNDENATEFAAPTVAKVLRVLAPSVKYRFEPSYSMAPLAGEVNKVPDVNLSGAFVVVPAAVCNKAVGAVVPIPTFPVFLRTMSAVPTEELLVL